MARSAFLDNPNIDRTKEENTNNEGFLKEGAVHTAAVTPTYSIVKTYNMKERHFIEGLEFYNSTHLILSDGYWGSSKIAYLQVSYPKVGSTANGNISMIEYHVLDSSIFGEGCTFFNSSIY